MGRHGSGQDLGRVSEWGYRLFARLPELAAFVIPVVLFVIVLEAGEAAVVGWRGAVAWLQPEVNYRVWAFFVVPMVALMVFMLTFEVALLTNVMRSGRWKLLRLQDSLRSVRALASRDFERLVGAAYELQGYRVDYAPDGADGGVDLVMHRGGDTVLVQCKNRSREWTGVSEVRELFGVLTAERASKGILVSSGVFSDEAHDFARSKPIQLVDGEELFAMIDTVQGAVLQAPRSAAASELNHEKLCPLCGAPTMRKTAQHGVNAGKSFWSCSRVPRCWGIAPD